MSKLKRRNQPEEINLPFDSNKKRKEAAIMAPLKNIPFISIFTVLISLILFSSCSDNTAGISLTTVSGTVIDYSGHRINNVYVSINKCTPVKTGTAGEFTIDKVTAPYDITVFNDRDSNFTVYSGLTGTNPVLTVRNQYPLSNITFANIVIKHPHIPAGKRVLTFPVCYDHVISGGSYSPNDSITEIGIQWPAVYNNTAGKLPFMICSSQSVNSIDSYDNFGIKDFSVAAYDNDTIIFTEQDISFNPPEIETQITIPSGYASIPVDMYLTFQNAWRYSQFYIFASNNFPGGTIKVPGGTGLDYKVMVHAYDNALTKECVKLITPGGADILEFALDEHLISPAADTSGVTQDTHFIYSNDGAGAIYTIEFFTDIPGYKVEINTTSTNVKLPDLSIFGKHLPSGTRISWQVTRRLGYNGMNDLASWAVCKNPVNPLHYNYTETRSFTTLGK